MKKGRFQTESAIIKLIDGCHERIKNYLAEAEGLEEAARQMAQDCSQGDTEQQGMRRSNIEYHRFRAAHIRRTVYWNEVRAHALGKKLAEFRTQTFAFMGGDVSIQK